MAVEVPFSCQAKRQAAASRHSVTQLQLAELNLSFVLDTGATNTGLFPPFASAFPDLRPPAAGTPNDLRF
jgi:hypothetical protein